MCRFDPRRWSLIIDRQPRRGSLNMAIDDFLFRSLGDEPRTYVRFYRWKRPTVSVGYTQNAATVIRLDRCRRLGVDVVRRMTGGKVVLHDKEITYSVSSSDSGIFTSTLKESYRMISLSLVRGLEKMGLKARLAPDPPAAYARGTVPCFSLPARDEVEVGGKKIVGSAQRRTGTKFIQHGSIPLEKNESLLDSVAVSEAEEISLTSLSDELGGPQRFEDAVEVLAEGIAEYFGISWVRSDLSEDHLRVVSGIEKRLYAARGWTLYREEN